MQNSDVGIVIYASDGSIIDCNYQASHLLGMKTEQTKGRTAANPTWIFVNEDESPLPPNEIPINLILADKKPIKNKLIGIYQSVTGNIVWVIVNGSPFLNNMGEITEAVINFIDITGRRQAELLLNQTRQNYKTFFNKIDDFLFVLDEEGRILHANNIMISPKINENRIRLNF